MKIVQFSVTGYAQKVSLEYLSLINHKIQITETVSPVSINVVFSSTMSDDPPLKPFKRFYLPGLVWLSGLSASLWTERLPVQFPVRACACAAGKAHQLGA